MHEAQIITMHEGSVQNYLDALEQNFDGKRTPNQFEYLQSDQRIKLSVATIREEFELILFEVNLKNAVQVYRTPDNRADYFHLSLMKEGHIVRNYEEQQVQAEAGTAMSLFLYNGLFSLDSLYPAKTAIRTVIFKFSYAALEKIIPEAIALLNSLFPDATPKGYHTQVTPELERIMDDLFFYETVDFGSQALITGRGLELYTLLMSSFKNQLDKDDLHGLHIDDYKRLIKIKEFILNHLNTKVSIEEICDRFGMSASKLKRDFKALFDCSVGQFYTQAKMDEASRLLRTGSFTVSQIAYDMGYQSISKFSTMFKKVKGVNPRDVIPV